MATPTDAACLAPPGAADAVQEALAQFLARALAAQALAPAFAAPAGRCLHPKLVGTVCAHCGHRTRGATLCRACRRLPAGAVVAPPLLQLMYEGGNPKYAETDDTRRIRAGLEHDLLQLQASRKLASILFELADESLRRPDPADHWVRVSPDVARWVYYTTVQWHVSPGGGRTREIRAGGLGIDLRDAINMRTREWLWRVDALHRERHALRLAPARQQYTLNGDFEQLLRWLAKAIALHVALAFPTNCPVNATLATSTLAEASAMQCERCLGPSGCHVADDNPALPFDLFVPGVDDPKDLLPPLPWAPSRLRLRVRPDRVAQLRAAGLDDDAVRAILLIDLVWTLREGGEIQDGVLDASVVYEKARLSTRQAMLAMDAVQLEYAPYRVADAYRASMHAVRSGDVLVEDELAHATCAVAHVSLQQLATFCDLDRPHLQLRAGALAARVHALVPLSVDVPTRFTAFLADGIALALETVAQARRGRCPCVPEAPAAAVLRLCPAVRAWAPSAGGPLRLAAAHLRRTPQVRDVLEALAACAPNAVRRLKGGRYEISCTAMTQLLGV